MQYSWKGTHAHVLYGCRRESGSAHVCLMTMSLPRWPWWIIPGTSTAFQPSVQTLTIYRLYGIYSILAHLIQFFFTLDLVTSRYTSLIDAKQLQLQYMRTIHPRHTHQYKLYSYHQFSTRWATAIISLLHTAAASLVPSMVPGGYEHAAGHSLIMEHAF